MDKKGNMYGAIIMTIMLFMVGMLVANFLKEPITDARTSLDCSNAAGISDGTKFLCLACDFTLIYWIILVISISGGVILDRMVLS